MICQATYDSLDAIPEALRDEFHQVDGKWQLKEDAVPGVGPLFNRGLAANEQRAIDQLKKKRDRVKELESENDTLRDKLGVLDSPGNKVLSKEDAALFDGYVKLGAPKEIENKIKAHDAMAEKVTQFETAESLAKVTEGTDINSDVLTDWATSKEGEGLQFFMKEVEQVDSKGAKTMVSVPHVRIEKKEDGKTTVSEKELLPFAKETLPGWKYEALTTKVEGDKKTVAKPVDTGGARLPNLGSATKAPSGDDKKERPVDKFNKERDAKPNPFSKPLAPVGAPQIK